MPGNNASNRLWFKFQKLISHEYVSQVLLSQFDITYTFELIEVNRLAINQVIYNEGVTADSIQNISVNIRNRTCI